MRTDNPLLWLDFETTGLDPRTRSIIEVGAILTDADLEVICHYHAFCDLPVESRNPREIRWDFAAFKMHEETGLLNTWTELDPGERRDIFVAEDAIVELVDRLDERPVLAGNSVHFDRRWLDWHMPDVLDELHHRQLDVSSVMRFVGHAGADLPDINEGTRHRAMDDLRRSISTYRACLELVREAPDD